MIADSLTSLQIGIEHAGPSDFARLLPALASPSTLCRLEQRADRDTAWAIHEVLFEQFVAAHPRPPRRLILDFDATDTPLHGEQEDRFFHGYYRSYCYLPLYVFCGRHLLVSYLRPSGGDAAGHAWAILSLLVEALRAHWPKVKIVFRGERIGRITARKLAI